MNSNVERREPPEIPEEPLLACLRDQYGLAVTALEFLPRGKDYHAGVYRVATRQSMVYLLKVKSGPLYEPACRVPSYLRNQGITAVVAPVLTKTHALWAELGDWTATVYPYIDGDTAFTGMSGAQWMETGSIFKQIHAAPYTRQDWPSLRAETFDPTTYSAWVHDFEAHHLDARPGEGESARALRAAWAKDQSSIHRILNTLEELAAVLRSRTFPYVICHADLHPANLIRDGTGHVFVVDWDDVMLAPRERDFIFIREPHADAFWQGYGHAEIDWTTLTYYRWERVVTDLIYDAGQVCLRDDLAEDTKAQIAGFFAENLNRQSSNVAAAYAAQAHLPRDLIAAD